MKDRAQKIKLLQAHPRSRGENGLYFGISVDSSGSSPLTRGKSRPP